jgi:hypothetical protein
MYVLLLSTILFAVAFAIHVAIWRTRVPIHQAMTLVIISVTVMAVGVAVAATEVQSDLPPGRLVLSVMLYCSLILVYLVLFSAVESESPTLTMIELVSRAKKTGVKRETLLAAAAQGSFAATRLHQLLESGLAIKHHDRILPGRRGRFFVDFVLAYRRLLGRASAGG